MNKQLQKISVITPSFNSGKCIERAIKSVLAQDYKNWEHIIIDGGSTDNTLAILKKYSHIKWISEKDEGQTDAMNKGFARSTGDIIVYLNADDFFFSKAFSSIIPEFEKGATFVVGNVFVKSPRLGADFMNTPRITLSGMLRHWETNSFCYNPVGYFYRREVQIACPFNKENYATQDLEFLLDAAEKFPFTKVEHTLGCFEDGKKTKTGVTQSKPDYWRSSTFPYIDKHINRLGTKDRIQYNSDRRKGYAQVQAYMNKLNKNSFDLIPVKNLPLISVIIPTYNCSEYICRAIDSILYQGLENLEIIVVDDASTDNTKELLSKYYKNNTIIRIIHHTENKKIGAARNTGIDAAKGKYVYFLDSDDWLEKGALIHLASVAEKNNADVVACGSQKVFPDGKVEPYHSFAFSCNGGLESLPYFTEHYIGSIAWNKLYLKNLITENNFRFVFPYWHEDTMFTLETSYACNKLISVNNVYHNYFQRNHSIVNSAPTLLHLESYIKLYSDMVQFMKKNEINSFVEGEERCYKLIKAHCSEIYFSKLLEYIRTRPQEEWESNCRNACYHMLGIEGYAIADVLICVLSGAKNTGTHYTQHIQNLKMSLWKNKIKFAILSPKKFIIKYLKKVLRYT